MPRTVLQVVLNICLCVTAISHTLPAEQSNNVGSRNFSPAVQEASKAFSEAMAGGADEGNTKKSKVFDSSKYCHEQTKECFAKNLATLPYGKLKYLTSILSRNFSAATSHGKDDMRFKTSSKLNSRVGAGASASTKQKFGGSSLYWVE